MLSTHTTLMVSHKGHYKGINQVIQTFLKVCIIIARDAAIQMQVSITKMTIANRAYRIFLCLSEIGGLFDDLTSCLNAPVIVLRLQADIILETIAKFDTSGGYLFAQIPNLFKLLHILCHYAILNLLASNIKQRKHLV